MKIGLDCVAALTRVVTFRGGFFIMETNTTGIVLEFPKPLSTIQNVLNQWGGGVVGVVRLEATWSPY